MDVVSEVSAGVLTPKPLLESYNLPALDNTTKDLLRDHLRNYLNVNRKPHNLEQFQLLQDFMDYVEL